MSPIDGDDSPELSIALANICFNAVEESHSKLRLSANVMKDFPGNKEQFNLSSPPTSNQTPLLQQPKSSQLIAPCHRSQTSKHKPKKSQ
ncbi:hypothetical protein TNCV_2835391 [Trichonephila clavipes]|uniref:Uncharacterized protein n=1 Tax=Trichonephila clavipes TaxID=2585209 RepID=A0A8X6RR19_TRICX|nr:hypothetical protein TNCV_2835391 [Trichonephila clavipes]